MHEWRSGLDFPFEQAEPAAPLDRDAVLADNLRLEAEVAQLVRRLDQATASLQRLSGRLMDLERHAARTAGAAAAAPVLQADLAAARAALAEAERRATEAEARLDALEATRVLRYTAGARSLYSRIRRAP